MHDLLRTKESLMPARLAGLQPLCSWYAHFCHRPARAISCFFVTADLQPQIETLFMSALSPHSDSVLLLTASGTRKLVSGERGSKRIYDWMHWCAVGEMSSLASYFGSIKYAYNIRKYVIFLGFYLMLCKKIGN
jgi:hypothetical protein